jgi:hypothetical protein
MPETPLPPDRPSTDTKDLPKRPYHAPKLRELGSVTDLTQGGTGNGTFDGSGYTS